MPIGEEYSSQANMKTLVLMMFIFLFLNVFISILCFISVYSELTSEGWIPSQNAVKIRVLSLGGWRPDPILSSLSESLEKQLAQSVDDTQCLWLALVLSSHFWKEWILFSSFKEY